MPGLTKELTVELTDQYKMVRRTRRSAASYEPSVGKEMHGYFGGYHGINLYPHPRGYPGSRVRVSAGRGFYGCR